jgi:hypothetical protein
VRLAPGVPGLEALGASLPADWLGDGSRLATGGRMQVLARGPVETVVRLPLPGTPDARGVQREAPRGAGTGMLVWRVWRGGARELLRARLTEPRSASLAARRWNLACHLAAHGVGVPELLAMGEGGAGASFLIERELAGYVPLARAAADLRDGAARGLLVQALGAALGAVLRAGVWLPGLNPEGVRIRKSERAGDGDCAALEVHGLAAEAALARSLGARRVRLPGVAFVDFAGARIARRMGLRRRQGMAAALAGVLAPAEAREFADRALTASALPGLKR